MILTPFAQHDSPNNRILSYLTWDNLVFKNIHLCKVIVKKYPRIFISDKKTISFFKPCIQLEQNIDAGRRRFSKLYFGLDVTDI